MNSLNGLVYCKDCGKRMKAKTERGKKKFVCSTYDNKGKHHCNRNLVTEQFLMNLVEFHFRQKDMIEEVSYILVKDGYIEINYSNGEKTTISNNLYLI